MKVIFMIDAKLEAALRPRRFDDQAKDAYTVFNRLQEKLIRGGLSYCQERETDKQLVWKNTRAVSSVSQSTKLNREFWNEFETVVAA